MGRPAALVLDVGKKQADAEHGVFFYRSRKPRLHESRPSCSTCSRSNGRRGARETPARCRWYLRSQIFTSQQQQGSAGCRNGTSACSRKKARGVLTSLCCTLVRAVHESAMRIFAALQYDFRKPSGRSVPVSWQRASVGRDPPPASAQALRRQGMFGSRARRRRESWHGAKSSSISSVGTHQEIQLLIASARAAAGPSCAGLVSEPP